MRRTRMTTRAAIALAVALVGQSADAQTGRPAGAATPPDGKRSVLSTDLGERAFQEQWGYAELVTSGDTIYLSGVPTGLAGPQDTLEKAYDRLFRRVATILARAGCTWDDVVEMTSFHTNLKAQFETMGLVKNRYVKAPFPAWTAVGASQLLADGAVTEVRVVARRRPTPGR